MLWWAPRPMSIYLYSLPHLGLVTIISPLPPLFEFEIHYWSIHTTKRVGLNHSYALGGSSLAFFGGPGRCSDIHGVYMGTSNGSTDGIVSRSERRSGISSQISKRARGVPGQCTADTCVSRTAVQQHMYSIVLQKQRTQSARRSIKPFRAILMQNQQTSIRVVVDSLLPTQ